MAFATMVPIHRLTFFLQYAIYGKMDAFHRKLRFKAKINGHSIRIDALDHSFRLHEILVCLDACTQHMALYVFLTVSFPFKFIFLFS